MKNFILFFCLLFGQIAPIQANYSAPQTVNYQVITADIANPIEPIQPKKSKKTHLQFEDWSSEEWANLAIGFIAVCFLLGLIFFPPAFIGSILWLCQVVFGLEAFGLLFSLIMALVFSRTHKDSKNWGYGVIVASFIIVPLVFLVLKGIELIWLGIILSLSILWIIGIILILLSIIVLLLSAN